MAGRWRSGPSRLLFLTLGGRPSRTISGSVRGRAIAGPGNFAFNNFQQGNIRLSEAHHGPEGARRFDYEPTYVLRAMKRLHLEFDPI